MQVQLRTGFQQQAFQQDASANSQPLPEFLQRIYQNRGVYVADQLHYGLSHLIPCDQMKNMAQAVALVMAHLRKSILILGDFDADGATSTSLLKLGLEAMGANKVSYLVPSRFVSGYGLSPEIAHIIVAQQPELVITVDNGITSIAGAAVLKEAGIRLLITDHHLPAATLPAADCILNPNQPGCPFPSKNLAGVGVAFYLLIALRAQLRQQAWFLTNAINEPNLAELLDLVALGTIADLVKLDYNNRILVQQGLWRMRTGRIRPGIAALLASDAQYHKLQNISSKDLAFSVAPKLNAAGRLDDMSLGINCLLSRSKAEAELLAAKLDQLNKERKAIQQHMQEEALMHLQKLEQQMIQTKQNNLKGICLHNSSWHQGVIGILAGKLKEQFGLPAIVFAPAEEGYLKGSARSIPSLHIRDMLEIIDSKQPELIKKFGGHAMAAGLEIHQEHLAAFTAAFQQTLDQLLTAEDLQQTIYHDGVLDAYLLHLNTARLILQHGPWGQGFAEPCFIGTFQIHRLDILAEKHIKLQLVCPDTLCSWTALAFHADMSQWQAAGHCIKIIYQLQINTYQRKERLQLHVLHLISTA